MEVTIVEYNEEWPKLFEHERDLLLRALGKAVAKIEHIGSTSVPGLAARPIIDIMIGLHNFAEADELVPKVTALGYIYVPEYEGLMPHRRFFRKKQNGKRTHHIHMVQVKSEFWKRHLAFTDYLRDNPEAAEEYALLKKELAKRRWDDTNDYAEAKSEFIREAQVQARPKKSR